MAQGRLTQLPFKNAATIPIKIERHGAQQSQNAQSGNGALQNIPIEGIR